MSRLETLYRERPRSRFLRVSLGVLAAITLYAWLSGDIEWQSFLTPRRLENLQRFLSVDAVPPEVRNAEAPLAALWSWGTSLFVERGAQATLATFAIAVLAILLASLLASTLAPFAASNLATRRPFDSQAHHESRGWLAVRFSTRASMIVLRAIPEYILAFLLLAILGPQTAWPAILALAIHNAGILGRLGAETIENLDPLPLRSLHAIGAPRRNILATAIFPQALGRGLLYFFYRFETCVREASVLGILGILSLGYWIEDARSKHFYDEMIFFVVLGALIVIITDFVSALARRYVREG